MREKLGSGGWERGYPSKQLWKVLYIANANLSAKIECCTGVHTGGGGGEKTWDIPLPPKNFHNQNSIVIYYITATAVTKLKRNTSIYKCPNASESISEHLFFKHFRWGGMPPDPPAFLALRVGDHSPAFLALYMCETTPQLFSHYVCETTPQLFSHYVCETTPQLFSHYVCETTPQLFSHYVCETTPQLFSHYTCARPLPSFSRTMCARPLSIQLFSHCVCEKSWGVERVRNAWEQSYEGISLNKAFFFKLLRM